MSTLHPDLSLDLGLVDVMIVLDRGHLVVEAMVEVIERTAMMMVDMSELRSEGTVKRGVSGSTMLWYSFDV